MNMLFDLLGALAKRFSARPADPMHAHLDSATDRWQLHSHGR